MLKKITIPLMILMLLVGCTSASGNIVLMDTQGEITPEDEAITGKGYTALPESRAANASETDPGNDPSYAESGREGIDETALQAEKLAVYVCGAVVNAGVYELDGGSRIVDAVDAAGGFSEDADTTYVNLAAKLTDGTKLLIPTLEQTSASAPAGEIDSFGGDVALGDGLAAGESAGRGLVNINTAGKEELKTLSGIGDSTADKIIRYREDNGGFRTIEDIMKISGIKEKLFSKIKDNITV